MGSGLRMVHLRTVPDPWHARVLAARLGAEGIVTHLQGNLAGPYPFGAVSVLVEADQAELAAALLLADEVEAAFPAADEGAPVERGSPAAQGHANALRWRRAVAAAAVVCVAGAPLLAHFVGY
jgi:hypothetical protein